MFCESIENLCSKALHLFELKCFQILQNVKNVHHNFPESKVMSANVFFCPNQQSQTKRHLWSWNQTMFNIFDWKMIMMIQLIILILLWSTNRLTDWRTQCNSWTASCVCFLFYQETITKNSPSSFRSSFNSSTETVSQLIRWKENLSGDS